jgi:hypothetical protein
MKQFLIYFSKANTPLASVHRIHNRAAASARRLGKTVAINEVDLDSACAELLKCCTNAGSIECATADNGACRERIVNPSAPQIDAMIGRL